MDGDLGGGSMVEEKMRWISGSGGPLILLPEELLEHWGGLDAPESGRVVQAKVRWDPDGPVTDYDRACDVEAPLAGIDVGAGSGIILGGEPAATTFLARPNGGLLVRWIRAESEGEVARHVEGRTFEPAGDDVALIEVRPGPLILFDAACPGYEVDADHIVIDLHPGRYMASAAKFDPDESTELVLITLERVG